MQHLLDDLGPQAKDISEINAADPLDMRVITEIDGQTATTNVQLQELTLTKQPGATVPIGYVRDGTAGKATVTLGSQP